jgi:hypothetical protein
MKCSAIKSPNVDSDCLATLGLVVGQVDGA